MEILHLGTGALSFGRPLPNATDPYVLLANERKWFSEASDFVPHFLEQRRDVLLRTSIYTPTEKKEIPQDEAVIFLPGWSMGAAHKATTTFGQAFADNAGLLCHSIETAAETLEGDTLENRAEAGYQYILSHKLKAVTLSGHSEGGQIAIHLAKILQKRSPDITIKGLILFDSVGLYDTTFLKLTTNFLRDAVLSSFQVRQAWRARQERLDAGITTNKDDMHVDPVKQLNLETHAIVSTMLHGIRHTPHYIRRLTNQIEKMSHKNADLDSISCPVVLVQGQNDKVSNVHRIAKEVQSTHLTSLEAQLLFPNSSQAKVVIQHVPPNHHDAPLQSPYDLTQIALFLLNPSAVAVDV